MDPNSTQTDRLFLQALKYPPDEQESFVRASCDGNPDLCAAVLALLVDVDMGSSFMEQPIGDRTLVQNLLEPAPWDNEAPETVGAFRIVKEIGRGGLGVVYLAERAEGGFDQRVALKLIRPGMDSDLVVRRFETERSLLASFQHPNIAQLVDGGLTDDGRPYFAMEYIDGLPVTTYCNEHRLDIRQRLELFRSVCRAVQYAHTNLVVHRDLKPSNILVYEDDAGKPVVKLLDFGIAKILSAEVGIDTTQTAIRAFTPGYAAPEQIRGLTPTVSTDIYSLGVVLYELISGRKPFDATGKSAFELERQILETEPERPSTVMAESVAGETPRNSSRSVLRDLDMVVLKAIRHEPDRRYASAEVLGVDIENLLGSRPVMARPDTLSYRSNRFIRRNKLGVGLAALLGIALIAAVVGTSWQARVASIERDGKTLEADRANATLDFVLGIFESVNPSEAEGAPVTARSIVDAALGRLDGLEEQPRTHAQMTAAVAQLSHGLGLTHVADSLWSISLDTRRALLEPTHPEIAESLLGRARAINTTDVSTTAIALAGEAVGIREQLYGARDPRTIDALNVLADSYYKNGNNEEALEQYEKLLSNLDQSSESRRLRGDVLYGMGTVLNALQRPDDAEPRLREAVTIRQTILGEKDPETIFAMYVLAETLRKQGKLEEANDAHRRVLPLSREVLGELSPEVGNSLMSIGFISRDLARYDEALLAFDGAYAVYVASYGATNGYRAIPIAAKGETLFNAGRIDEAISLLREAIAIYRDAFGPSYTRLVQAEIPLAQALMRRGQFAEAGRLLEHVTTVISDKPHRTDIADKANAALSELEQLRGR